jgi:hypothetical protein
LGLKTLCAERKAAAATISSGGGSSGLFGVFFYKFAKTNLNQHIK